MSLNKNSNRKKILNYIKTHPFAFLYHYSDKPWAQPYIDEAAKRAAKKDSTDFLRHFSNDSWAQPYIDEAAKEAAIRYSFYLLFYFSDETWAQPYIDEAAKEAAKLDPEYFLEKWANRFPQGINWALFALGSKNVAE